MRVCKRVYVCLSCCFLLRDHVGNLFSLAWWVQRLSVTLASHVLGGGYLPAVFGGPAIIPRGLGQYYAAGPSTNGYSAANGAILSLCGADNGQLDGARSSLVDPSGSSSLSASPDSGDQTNGPAFGHYGLFLTGSRLAV